jgi:hypothetical protein
MERLTVPSLNKGKLAAAILGGLAALTCGIMIENRARWSASAEISATDAMWGEAITLAAFAAILAFAAMVIFATSRVQEGQGSLAADLAKAKEELSEKDARIVELGEAHAQALRELTTQLAGRATRLLRAGERAETAVEQMMSQAKTLEQHEDLLRALARAVEASTAAVEASTEASAKHVDNLSGMVAAVLVEGWHKGHADEEPAANGSSYPPAMAGAQVIPLHPLT